MAKNLAGDVPSCVDLNDGMGHLKRRPVLVADEVVEQTRSSFMVGLVGRVRDPCTVGHQLLARPNTFQLNRLGERDQTDLVHSASSLSVSAHRPLMNSSNSALATGMSVCSMVTSFFLAPVSSTMVLRVAVASAFVLASRL